MMPGMFGVALLVIQVFVWVGLASDGVGTGRPAGPAYGTYQWPVRGPVIRGFDPPPDPYGSGHRGIDIAAPFGSRMVAAQDGVVAFAGWVGGALFISIDHPDGVRTSYSWLSDIHVKRGAVVSRGSFIGATGQGHPGITPPHLHLGARVRADYIDPILLLEGANVVDLIHLAPLLEPSPPGRALSMESFSTDARLTARAASLVGSSTGLLASRTGHLRSFSRERGPPFTPLLQ